MVRGLAETHARAIVAARPAATAQDLCRRAGVPAAALTRIAEADGFRPTYGLARREALWAIRGHQPDLPLFAAIPAPEPAVALSPMPAGREVVQDYAHTGVTLRRHPLSFLRDSLTRRRIRPCAEAMASADRRWMHVAGLVLVRQRPGSAKGVMFITLEDESGIANLVLWPKVFNRHRRIVLGAGMIGVEGRVQRAGEVVHLVAHRLTDMSAELASVGRQGAFPLPHGRGDEFHRGAPPPDPRSQGPKPRQIYVRDLPRDGITVKTRDFR